MTPTQRDALLALAELINRELAENDGERLSADVAMSVAGRLRTLAAPAAGAAVVTVGDGSDFDKAMRAYEFEAEKHGRTRSNAQCVDAAGACLLALYNAKAAGAGTAAQGEAAGEVVGYAHSHDMVFARIEPRPPIGTKLYTTPPAASAVAVDGLHPRTADLVQRFASALAEKLAAAERKYGYSDGWAESEWMDECRAKLVEHVAKGEAT